MIKKFLEIFFKKSNKVNTEETQKEIIKSDNSQRKEETPLEKAISQTRKSKGRLEHFFIGEITDPFHNTKTEIITANSLAHLIISGMTGSGKTTCAMSIIQSMAHVCKEVEGGSKFFCFDGKGDNNFSKIASPLSEKKIGTSEEDFENTIKEAYQCYEERLEMFKNISEETGKEIRTIFEYREQIGQLQRVFIVVEEPSQLKIMKNYKKELDKLDCNSTVYKLNRLLTEARLLGFTCIFVSQQVKKIPKELIINFCTKIILKDTKENNVHLGLKDGSFDLKRGEGLMFSEGLGGHYNLENGEEVPEPYKFKFYKENNKE